MGDPAGIGPEIVVRALSHKETYTQCLPLVTGDAAVMENAVKVLGLPMTVHPIDKVADARFEYGCIDVYDLKCLSRSIRANRCNPQTCVYAPTHH